MRLELFSVLMIILLIGMTPSIYADSLPNWTKNIAGWWGDGFLSDQIFIDSIQFLEKEEFISVKEQYDEPLITKSDQGFEELPKWYKNTAKWASQGSITEEVFLDSLEYLVNKKIIVYDTEFNLFSGYSSYDEVLNDDSLSDEDQWIINDKFAPLISGYRGATFDGESVYFAPYYNNYDRHGIMVKYDTTLPFDDINSWNVFNVGYWDIKGFQGALYHDNYVYYVPYHFDKTLDEGTAIIRYNTTLDFRDPTSWELAFYYDIYEDGVVADNFIYFSPHFDKNNDRNAIPLRYDPSKPFGDNESWVRYETGLNTSYIGATFDGQYVYYAPFKSDNKNFMPILIHDTTKNFSEKQSWSEINIPYAPYSGTGFNGTHVVMAPYCFMIDDENQKCSKILFLESESQEISYSELSYGSYNGVVETDDAFYLVPYMDEFKNRADFIKIQEGIETFSPLVASGAYWGGIFDGQYVYYTPYDFPNSLVRNGEFLRYDTTLPFDADSSWEIKKLNVKDFNYNFEQDMFEKVEMEK